MSDSDQLITQLISLLEMTRNEVHALRGEIDELKDKIDEQQKSISALEAGKMKVATVSGAIGTMVGSGLWLLEHFGLFS